jgi:hypothetical protein
MDESGEDGVILVSFGSVLKASGMTKEQKYILGKTFLSFSSKFFFTILSFRC